MGQRVRRWRSLSPRSLLLSLSHQLPCTQQHGMQRSPGLSGLTSYPLLSSPASQESAEHWVYKAHSDLDPDFPQASVSTQQEHGRAIFPCRIWVGDVLFSLVCGNTTSQIIWTTKLESLWFNLVLLILPKQTFTMSISITPNSKSSKNLKHMLGHFLNCNARVNSAMSLMSSWLNSSILLDNLTWGNNFKQSHRNLLTIKLFLKFRNN